jgi:hypothetical protein
MRNTPNGHFSPDSNLVSVATKREVASTVSITSRWRSHARPSQHTRAGITRPPSRPIDTGARAASCKHGISFTDARSGGSVALGLQTTSSQSHVWDHVFEVSKHGSSSVVTCNYCDRKNWKTTAFPPAGPSGPSHWGKAARGARGRQGATAEKAAPTAYNMHL